MVNTNIFAIRAKGLERINCINFNQNPQRKISKFRKEQCLSRSTFEEHDFRYFCNWWRNRLKSSDQNENKNYEIDNLCITLSK